MSEIDRKKSVMDALMKHHEKLLPKQKTMRNKRNEKPEAKFMLELKKHLISLGVSIDIVESKANFSESAGRYTHGAVRSGFSDMVGNFADGTACYIEVKAKNRRSTLRVAQHEFLLQKISTNAFAIVCDSIEYFDLVYAEWKTSSNRKAMLLRELPALAPRYVHDNLDDIELA